ncbi:hypothetical protein DV707_06080 [Halobellus limi]|uniref:Halobacterial output domain-containing protein n=1 Tax=Halobellus limi TaxID=699433 RepID=A0A1H5TNA5_9EURY|nr:hypothetical protein DV707_06080 [Halobellus limi]SEF64246.1 hypothetical protein SAMN04488133_0332 [Halobellus limi]
MSSEPSDSIEFSEESELVIYERQDDTSFEDDLLTAFEVAGADLEDQGVPMMEFVDPFALAQLNWDNPQLEVRTTVWGYPLRITPEAITIYSRE